MIHWTASNDDNKMIGTRSAFIMAAAVRDAHNYVKKDLQGEGKIYYYKNNDHYVPVRIDEKSIYTDFEWETKS